MAHNRNRTAERSLYADPTFEAAYRALEAEKRKRASSAKPCWAALLRKRRRIQRLLRDVMSRRR